MIPVKGKRSLKKKKDIDVSSVRNWEGEVIPLEASPLAYLALGSSHVVVLHPGSALGCCFLFTCISFVMSFQTDV